MARYLAVVALLVMASCASPIGAVTAPVGGEVTDALSAEKVITAIKGLTSKSHALQSPAQAINIVNAPLLIIGQGPFPQIIAGFTDIVNTAANEVVNLGSPKYNEGDASAIEDAFHEFVQVHQTLLNILIGKAGLLEHVPIVGPPVAAVLRQDEAIVDSLAFSLMDACDSQASNIAEQQQSLVATLSVCISSYDRLV